MLPARRVDVAPFGAGQRPHTALRVLALHCTLQVLALVGCSRATLLESIVPAEEVAFAKSFVALFSVRDFDTIEAQMHPALRAHAPRAKLAQIAALLPEGQPDGVEIVAARFNRTGETTTYRLALQYKFSERWLLAHVDIERRPATRFVTGVHLQPLRDSLENLNRFTLEGKGVLHFLVLGAAVLVPAFILLSVVLCVRTPIGRRKWLWVLFILVGFGRLSLDWTTGNYTLLPVHVQLFGASISSAGPSQPMLVSVAFPLGAIVFMLMRRRWTTAPAHRPED